MRNASWSLVLVVLLAGAPEVHAQQVAPRLTLMPRAPGDGPDDWSQLRLGGQRRRNTGIVLTTMGIVGAAMVFIGSFAMVLGPDCTCAPGAIPGLSLTSVGATLFPLTFSGIGLWATGRRQIEIADHKAEPPEGWDGYYEGGRHMHTAGIALTSIGIVAGMTAILTGVAAIGLFDARSESLVWAAMVLGPLGGTLLATGIPLWIAGNADMADAQRPQVNVSFASLRGPDRLDGGALVLSGRF
jgi:hypothetical protein